MYRSWGAVRVVVSAASGGLVFLATIVGSCIDLDGVPTWERCWTWLGTPALFEWNSAPLDIGVPLILGFVVGATTWWVLGKILPTAE